MNTDDTASLLASLLEVETAVWDALVAGDASADAALLSDSFLGVYPDGFAGKADHAGQLNEGPSVATYHLQEARVMRLGSEHALLSYGAKFNRPNSDQSEVMFVSLIWQRNGQGWINVFSQDTPRRHT